MVDSPAKRDVSRGGEKADVARLEALRALRRQMERSWEDDPSGESEQHPAYAVEDFQMVDEAIAELEARNAV